MSRRSFQAQPAMPPVHEDLLSHQLSVLGDLKHEAESLTGAAPLAPRH